MFPGFILLCPAIRKGKKRLPEGMSGNERVTSAHDFTSMRERQPFASAAVTTESLYSQSSINDVSFF